MAWRTTIQPEGNALQDARDAEPPARIRSTTVVGTVPMEKGHRRFPRRDRTSSSSRPLPPRSIRSHRWNTRALNLAAASEIAAWQAASASATAASCSRAAHASAFAFSASFIYVQASGRASRRTSLFSAAQCCTSRRTSQTPGPQMSAKCSVSSDVERFDA